MTRDETNTRRNARLRLQRAQARETRDAHTLQQAITTAIAQAREVPCTTAPDQARAMLDDAAFTLWQFKREPIASRAALPQSLRDALERR